MVWGFCQCDDIGDFQIEGYAFFSAVHNNHRHTSIRVEKCGCLKGRNHRCAGDSFGARFDLAT